MKRYTSPDGVSIAYYQWGEASAAPPVVLHHGFVANANLNWVATGIVDALVNAGRRVLAVDARGHGASDKPHDPALYGETNMARDLIGLLTQLDVPVYDLVGYSMGAIVSLITATLDHARLRRLVIGGVGEGVVVCGGVDTRALPALALAEVLEAAVPPAGIDPALAGMAAFIDAVGGDRKALAAQCRAVNATAIALDRIGAPTLVLAGRDDTLAVRPERLAQAIPRAKLELLGGDHLGAVRDPRFIPALLEHIA
jgi:pimeloyl-ACP methyl ester carboxylesterase